MGIRNARDTDSLWLLFQVKDGNVGSVTGLVSEGDETPQQVEELAPIILASGEKQVWMLIPSEKEKFYEKVAAGELNIGGDFREFGRLTGRLIRLTEQAGLWTQLDTIFDQVHKS